MTKTELALLAIHKAPVVKLADICERYLNCNLSWARQKAALHTLPFPCFRIDEEGSQKSPWVVRVTDLAAFLDTQADAAAKAWTHSQV